jgi:alkylhydroperoxidase family enzyme
MSRLEPIPLEALADEPRRIIEEGFADGTYATPIPLQVFAYRTQQLLETHDDRMKWGKGTLLGGRILELLRIRSAQLGQCEPCMQSRKHESISDEDVAGLLAPGRSELTEQERLAVQFLDLLSADHHAIDAETYRELSEVFTAAQIVELGFSCAASMGLHRFIHTLDLFGADAPVIPFSPDQVDTAYEDPTHEEATEAAGR